VAEPCSADEEQRVSEGTALSFEVEGSGSVSALLVAPAQPSAAYVFAHGAGAGMRHPFMARVADRLAAERIATLRYQFPSMERGAKRPDVPRVAHATVRAAVAEANALLPGLPLFAGGKSFGGRMTSQAQAAQPLPSVRGLVFLGFPLHPAGRPASERGEHLANVAVPMLFVQGTRDELADNDLIRTLVAGLGARATLATIDDADHAFHVRRASGSDDAQVLGRIAATMREWMRASSP
jgi:predicted alpha/beta-hydrolase family hydrolase